MPQKIDETYIRKLYGDLPPENVKKLINAMKKYDISWWESKDPVEVAKYQIFEDTLMVDFALFHEGIEKLLGRPVYTHEFALNINELREEAREAIARMEGKGKPLDERVAAERVRQGIKTLLDYAEKTGKPVFGVFIPKDKKYKS